MSRVIPARKADRIERQQYQGGPTLTKDRYDFSTGRPNLYAKLLKKPVSIRLDAATTEYFKALAVESDIPYQTLINLYLRDCPTNHRRPDLKWRGSKAGAA